MKSMVARVLLWLTLLLPVSVQAAPPLALLSESGRSYTAMLAALQQLYPGTFDTAVLPDAVEIDRRMTVAIGSRACEYMIAQDAEGSRTLCIFLPSQTFDNLTSGPTGARLVHEGRLSAIYLDQPIIRQMRLAQALKPDMKTIGTVLGPGNDRQAELFTRTAQELGLEPLVGRLEGEDNPVRKLTPVIENSDLFLPLPDRSVFNRAAAKWILYISLRNRVPLVGFSAKYADAGAVVALYSSIEQIAQQTADVLRMTGSDDPLPPPAFPRDFSITVNQTAARNLNLVLPPTDSLIHRLKDLEVTAK